MPKTAKFTLQYLCLFLRDSRLPAVQTLPHGAAPHDYRFLLKVLYHRVFPRKKRQGGSAGIPECGCRHGSGRFQFSSRLPSFLFSFLFRENLPPLMKRVPETDQPSSRDDSHQEPTENFTPHASDHGESAENAEHTGGESVRRIGK